jgi:hypothetical protein
MQQELMAFWSYDQFPYLLWSEVVEFTPAGRARVKGYGGSAFVPVYVLPVEQGEELAEKLAMLRDSYNDAVKNMRESFNKQLDQLLPFKRQ